MGIRRLGRARLHGAESKGKDVLDDILPSADMKGTIVSAYQHRQGHQLTTDILVDLGSSKVDVISGGEAASVGDCLGAGSTSADVSYLCKMDQDVFGAITAIETVCLEVPVGSNGFLTGDNAFALKFGDGDGYLNAAPGGSPQMVLDDIGNKIGEHKLKEYDNFADSTTGPKDRYLYICVGASGSTDHATKATATITFGTGSGDPYAIARDFTDAQTRLTLTDAGGVVRNYLCDTDGTAYSGGQDAGEFNVNGGTTADHYALGLKTAIDGTHSFVATVSNNVVTVTQSADGVVGNQTNYWVDGPGKTASITVGNFTGGKTKGSAESMTAGKFLIRFTGFVEPDDL